MAKKNAKNLNQTEIIVVLDRSGSMGSIAPATVEGFNKFLLEQQNSEGEAFITLIQFDDRYELNYKGMPVKEAAPLILGESFKPRGGTALLDAIGKTIEELKTDRDVVFVIITDGEENQSRTYKKEAINKMIESLTEEEGWKFLFLAANQDAIRTGGGLGIKASNSMTYSADDSGAINVFASVSANMSNYRSSKADLFSKSFSSDVTLTSIEKDLDFSDKQRKDSK
jgi:hypothetical protein